MKKQFLSGLLVCGLVACNPPESTEFAETMEFPEFPESPELAEFPESGDASATGQSGEIAGVYQGVLPCADCGGIENTLTLRANNTFTWRRTYLKNEPLSTPEQTGKWELRENVIELFPVDVTSANAHERQCFGAEKPGMLRLFDIQCAPMEENADNILRKQGVE